MFFVHEVPALSLRDNRCIVRGVCPMLPETSLDALMRVLASAETRAGDDLLTKAVTLSTRQVVRIARRLERYAPIIVQIMIRMAVEFCSACVLQVPG